MTRKILALLLCMLGVASINAQTDNIRIVVFDLSPKSQEVSADSAMLSELLRNEFIKTGRFEVVSREQTANIMSEAEFQTSGVSSEAGAIKLGKLLNVKRAIAGSVGTLGGTVFVTVQLFDLETGRFITAESMEAPTVRDIVSRMKTTVAVLSSAAEKAEGIASTGNAKSGTPTETKPAPAPVERGGTARRGPSIVNWIGYGSAAAGLGALAVGYFVFDKQAATAYQKALASKAAYSNAIAGSDFATLWATYAADRAAVQPLATTRLICYIGGGVLAAGGIVLAVLPPPRRSLAKAASGWRLAMLPGAVFAAFEY